LRWGSNATLGLSDYQRLAFGPDSTQDDAAGSTTTRHWSSEWARLSRRSVACPSIIGPAVTLKAIDAAAALERALTLQNGA